MKRLRKMCAAVLILALSLAGCGKPKSVDALPPFGADITATSVSGLSSGAYMAAQFHLAFARDVIGVGLIAGGPWACAQSAFSDYMPGPGQAVINVQLAINGCMKNNLSAWGIPNAAKLAIKAEKLARNGAIDPLAQAARTRIYLFAGTQDHVVMPQMAKHAKEFYRHIDVPEGSIRLVDQVAAGHAFVTKSQGSRCGTTEPPYIVACDYDQPGDMLRHLRAAQPDQPASENGRIIQFDQSEFMQKNRNASIADVGYAYVPDKCSNGPACHVHIVFHGCTQSHEVVGKDVVLKTGMLAWADAHRLILLFPQVQSSSLNPKGCWDWWGYTGDDFLTRSGAQLKAVRGMLERLGQPNPAH